MSVPNVRGKAFHGVRLLHIQMSPHTEYIFPHQLRKRLFPALTREQFQHWKKKANIEERIMTPQEIVSINESIAKSGGTTKVNDNCSLILLECAEALYHYLTEVDAAAESKVSASEGAERKVGDGTAKVLSGPIINIELKEYEHKPFLHILFESGYYLLLNQLRRLLFSHVNKVVFLGVIKRHGVQVYTVQAGECARVNSFMEQEKIHGHNRSVDNTSPLITKLDAAILKQLCSSGDLTTDATLAGRENVDCKEEDTDSEDRAAVSISSGSESAPAVCTMTTREKYKGFSPDPWRTAGPTAQHRDTVTSHSTLDTSTDNIPACMSAISQQTREDERVREYASPKKRRKSNDDQDPDSMPATTTPGSSAKKSRKRVFGSRDKVSNMKLKLAKQRSQWYSHQFSTRDLSDLEVRDVRESVVNVDDQLVTVGDATIAGGRFTVLRSPDDELMCVVSEVFKLFFGGAYDYQKRQWWQKRCQYREKKISELEYTALTNIKRRIFKLSKLMSVTALQRVLAKHTLMVDTNKTPGKRPKMTRQKSCGLQQILGVVVAYVLKDSTRWFRLQDVRAVYESVGIQHAAIEESLRRCHLQPCLPQDMKFFNIEGQGNDGELLIKAEDVHKLEEEFRSELVPRNVADDAAMESMTGEAQSGNATYITITADPNNNSLNTVTNTDAVKFGDHQSKEIQILLKDCHESDLVNSKADGFSLAPSGHAQKVAQVEGSRVSKQMTDITNMENPVMTKASLPKMEMPVPQSNTTNSAFQSSEYLLIPKTYLKPADSRCVLIERTSEKKLHILYVDKQAVTSNGKLAASEEKQAVTNNENPTVSDEKQSVNNDIGSIGFDDGTENVYPKGDSRTRPMDTSSTAPSAATTSSGDSKGEAGCKLSSACDIPSVSDPGCSQRIIGSVSAIRPSLQPPATNIVYEKCEAKLRSYVSMFVKSQAMMKESMSGLLKLSIDMQRELCQLEEEIVEEREVNDSLTQQLEALTAQYTH